MKKVLRAEKLSNKSDQQQTENIDKPQKMTHAPTENGKVPDETITAGRNNVPPEPDVSQDPCRIFNRINVHKNTSNTATLNDQESPPKNIPADILHNPLKIFDRVRVQPTPIVVDKK